MATPPYPIIASTLKDGLVVPFLGAGASVAGARPQGATFDPRKPVFLPTGAELATALASDSEFPSDDEKERQDLAKVCSYFTDVAGRKRLRRRLHELTRCDVPGEPGTTSQVHGLHHLIATIAAPLVVVTTNYDTLMEQAFAEAGRPFDVIVYPADRVDMANAVLWWPHGAVEPQEIVPNELDVDFSTRTVLFKMHGSRHATNPDLAHYVITEEDYLEFLARMSTNAAVPSIFFPVFEERSFLFLGYSLRDWNLRLILRRLGRQFEGSTASAAFERIPAWAIQRSPSALEQRLWRQRNVEIFDVSLDEFVERLRVEMGQ